MCIAHRMDYNNQILQLSKFTIADRFSSDGMISYEIKPFEKQLRSVCNSSFNKMEHNCGLFRIVETFVLDYFWDREEIFFKYMFFCMFTTFYL